MTTLAPARTTIDTPVGPLALAASDAGLCELTFAPDGAPRHHAATGPHPVLAEASRQLRAYFEGGLRAFDLPLAPAGTAFQHAVWHALLKIPFGQTQSYTHIARAIGNPAAVRAVGLANGRNPISIIIPCHRVIGADGSLTGYGGGLDRKRWLLEHEEAEASGQTTRSPLFEHAAP